MENNDLFELAELQGALDQSKQPRVLYTKLQLCWQERGHLLLQVHQAPWSQTTAIPYLPHAIPSNKTHFEV